MECLLHVSVTHAPHKTFGSKARRAGQMSSPVIHHICATVRSCTDYLSTSHHRILSSGRQGNSFVKQCEWCHETVVKIQEQNHKYGGRSEAFSPPEAACLTFHLTQLSVSTLCLSPAANTTSNSQHLGREGREKVRKAKNVCRWETEESRGWGTGSITSLRSSNQTETPKSCFEDLHFGSSFNVSNI